MNKTLLTATLALGALSLTACAGQKTRTSAEWQADIGQSFSMHSADLKACYDSAGTKSKVALSLHLAATKHKDGSMVSVESVGTSDAPGPLVECVKHIAGSIVVAPEDKKDAKGTWMVTFDPEMGVSTDAMMAPKA